MKSFALRGREARSTGSPGPGPGPSQQALRVVRLSPWSLALQGAWTGLDWHPCSFLMEKLRLGSL